MATAKTNAMRILERARIPYLPHTYEHKDGAFDSVAVATKLGQPLEQVFKTLVTVGHSKQYFVFVIPVAKELNLKKAAKSVGEKSVEMIHVKDINKVTGYIRGGCSPIGMKKAYRTVVDSSCLQIPSIVVSGGKIGFQVELKPEDLLRVVPAETAEIAE